MKDQVIQFAITQWRQNGAENNIADLKALTGLFSPQLDLLYTFLNCIPINFLSDNELAYILTLPLTNFLSSPPDTTTFDWTTPQYSSGNVLNSNITNYLLYLSNTNLSAWVEYVNAVGT
jgi:hypothetical protein